MLGAIPMLGALGVGLLTLVGMIDAHAEKSPTPLLDYAGTVPSGTLIDGEMIQRELNRITHELERTPPPETDCAKTLGAGRFATLLDDLGTARASLGDSEGAIDAYREALECNPRAVYLHADLATELMHSGRFDEARTVTRTGSGINPSDIRLGNVTARLDFIQEQWTDAVARLKVSVIEAEDDDQAAYLQCFLWLAQRRAGIRNPELASRELVIEWPRPLLDALRDRITEADVLEAIKEESNERRQREILSEALYYLGQKRMADGETDIARQYFAATANLKVRYFVEHYMALAELTKIRARQTQED